MSVTTDVILYRDRLPTPEAWLSAVRAAGFELVLDTDFAWDEVEGWLPCAYKGVDTGFELDVSDVDSLELFEEIGFTAEDLDSAGERDVVVTFTTRGDFRELLAATLAAAVLCSVADGLMVPGEPPFVVASEAIAWARGLIPEYEEEIARQDGDTSD